MNDSKRVWAWVGVAVVVIVIIVWAVWNVGMHQQASSGPVPVYAPQGQLVAQFPKGLIVDSAATISGSYSIAYATSTNQYTAEYDSSSTMAALYKQYQTYLPANGWTITGTLTTHPTYEAIAAAQNGAQLQVVIESENEGSQVTVTYLVK